MLVEFAKWIVLLFAVFIIFVGFLMLFAPKKARNTLRKAGSTNFINYTEITVRLIPAIALILYADSSKIPEAFKIFGWIMLLTSMILYMVPRKIHHQFSMKSAAVTNTGFASGGVTCKLGTLCFVSSAVLVDSYVLRNPHITKPKTVKQISKKSIHLLISMNWASCTKTIAYASKKSNSNQV